MRKLKTELLNTARRNWDSGGKREYTYAREIVATVSSARKTFDVETWRAVRRGLKALAGRGLRSASVRVYETYESARTGKSKVVIGANEVFVEMPDAPSVEKFYRLLLAKMDSEDLDARASATNLSRRKAKHRVDFAWVSLQDQVNYKLSHAK